MAASNETAYLVIDIQRDYFPGGAMVLEGAEAAADASVRALRAARRRGLPVILVHHEATSPAATFFRAGTEGTRIHPPLQDGAATVTVKKHYPNAFRETDLAERLGAMGVRTLVVAGMMTHMCIDTTVRAAADLGYGVTLLGDATATRALTFAGRTVAVPEVQGAYLAALHGSFARVTTVDEWIAGNSEV